MRVIVCGGRDCDDGEAIYHALAELSGRPTIVHGAARGADRLAGRVARGLCLDVEAYPADWQRHGKGAGPIRNQQMLDAGADLVIAFPGGRGTADMVRRARAAGVPVREVTA
jgi:hypothetical protein